MILNLPANIDLAYCQNVHPSQNWDEMQQSVFQFAPAVREAISPGDKSRFGIGLRLSNEAVEEVTQAQLLSFADQLAEQNLYSFTMNAFPFGNFCKPPVKQKVYQPAWWEPARVRYTCKVARVLAELLPADKNGTISTVPIGYKFPAPVSGQLQTAVQNIKNVAHFLADLFEETGKKILLGLEPEPDCVLGSTDEFIKFYQQYFFSDQACCEFVGICFDTSHQAVEFENISQSLRKIVDAKIPVSKIQISSALQFSPDEISLKQSADFCEPVFLHQTKLRKKTGGIISFADLDDALVYSDFAPDDLVRVHFHTPVFADEIAGLKTTRDLLLGDFADLIKKGVCEHLEIETYTWGHFASEQDLVFGIANEYRWVLEKMFAD